MIIPDGKSFKKSQPRFFEVLDFQRPDEVHGMAVTEKQKSESESNSQSHEYCSFGVFVTPVISFFNWTLLLPHKIGYDNERQAYVSVKGSWLRQILCAITNLLMIIYLLGALKLEMRKTNTGGAMGAMFNVMYTVYISYACAQFYIGWTKFEKIAGILQEVDRMARHFFSLGIAIPHMKRVKRHVWLITLLHVIYALLSSHIVHQDSILPTTLLNAFTTGNWSEHCYKGARRMADRAILSFGLVLRLNSEKPEDLEISTPLVIMIAILFEFVEMCIDFFWVLGNCYIFLWGILFHKLYNLFYLKVKTNCFLNGDIVEDIRDYNRLSILTDKFNDVFGSFTLQCALAAICYVSVTSASLVQNQSGGNSGSFSSIVGAVGFIPFTLFLVSSAHVNYLASRFASLLRCQFTNGKESWPSDGKRGGQLNQGLAIVHQDISSNAVGFQGMGFFTVSYGLIGTFVSTIATYAILALQLQTPK